MSSTLDKSDKCLLEAIQTNNRMTVNELAETCNLSVSSVQRRLKHLRESKFIDAETATLNPASLGKGMTFILKVELEKESRENLDTFRHSMLADANVQQCYYVTGEEDFILICLASSLEEFDQITQRLLFDNNNVRRFKTSVVLSRDKVGLTVPISK